jgi:hypothetical protein
MNDAVEGAMEGYGTEGDIDKAYEEVCAEVGIELAGEVSGPGTSKMGVKAKVKKI